MHKQKFMNDSYESTAENTLVDKTLRDKTLINKITEYA